MADTHNASKETRGRAHGERARPRMLARARAAALAALALIAIPPLLLICEDACYGVPSSLSAIVMADDPSGVATGSGECFGGEPPSSPALPVRAALGAEILCFLFVPIAATAAAVLGFVRFRAAGAAALVAVVMHVATLALGSERIGGPFADAGRAALEFAPVIYGAAAATAAAFALVARRARPSSDRSGPGRP